MKPKGVATERKAPSEYILVVLFVQLLLLKRVHFLAFFNYLVRKNSVERDKTNNSSRQVLYNRASETTNYVESLEETLV